MKRKMCQTIVRNISEEPVADKEVWSFLASALDKKRAAKRKRPDMYREALLQRTVERLNEEITERCMKKTKKKKVEQKYDWKDGPNGWCMTNGSFQEDDECDALLGINSFFSELSKLKPNQRKKEDDGENANKSTILPSFSETFGKTRTKKALGSESFGFDATTTSSGTNMASCRIVSFQPQVALIEQFDSLCC